jgi:3-hydroxy-3-methylglutaryl CoA synthase
MTDVGITSYGVYVPWYRLSRKLITTALGAMSAGALPGNKAVANYDEDSLTMAVAAGRDCLNGVPREDVRGLFLATTSAPYVERESAAIMATALDLPADIRTADFTDSLKSGTGALLAASDAVKAGGAGSVLVGGADCRLGKPGSAEEMIFGDGAAALLLGSDGVVAALEGTYSVAYDFPDYRRMRHDKFVRATESRFIREEGYSKIVPEAISGLLRKYHLEAKDLAKVAYPCLSQRDHAAIGRRLGLPPEQVQEPLLGEIGETGAASPLLLLAAMLEGAQPGDNILVVSYGNGADALLFRVTDEILKVRDRGRLKRYIGLQQPLSSYEKYLIFRGVMPVEVASAEEIARTQLPLTWRERKAILALYGSKCKRCGTPQYPRQRVCINPACGATDEMEDYRFSDKKAKFFTYTEDHVSASLNPPLLYGMLDFEGGGRFPFELTDCESGSLKTGMAFEMSLRRKYLDESRSLVGYAWKGIPVRKEE